MKKTTTRATILARNTRAGLELYLSMAGEEHYLVTRRHNGPLWQMLKDGKTVGQLSRMTPDRGRQSQRLCHQAAYILKVLDDYINFELAA